MNNQIVRQDNSLIQYTPDQIDLVKRQIAPKATDDELKLFLYQCQRTGLDALSRQIYAIHRRSGNEEKMTIQTSIDGFRVIAERSGVYAGQSEPEFIEDEKGNLKCCKITVRKFSPNGQIYDAAVGVAYWDEYVQQKDEWKNGQKTGKKIPSEMWTKMPHTMLAKVAEALALRKAFPNDLSGLYTGDEMQQADLASIANAPFGDTTVADEELQTTPTSTSPKISIKEAKARAEVIKEAVKCLLDCETVGDLTKLKDTLKEEGKSYVFANESFKEAATQRFDELTKDVKKAEEVVD